MNIRIEAEGQTETGAALQTAQAEQVQPDVWHIQRVLYDTIRRVGWSIGVTGGAFALGGAMLALFIGGFSSGMISTGLFAAGHIAVGGYALGNVAVGGIAVGNAALGLIALGNAAAGLLLAAGNAAVGAVAIGNGALGLLAFGNGARGLIAVGQNARGLIAIGHRAKGLFVLAHRGEGEYVIDAERHDEKAVDFFTRRLPRLRPAFGQQEPILADPLRRDPARTQEKALYERFLHTQSDETVISEAVSMGESVVPVLVKWLTAWQPRVRARAAEALKRIGGPVVSLHLQTVLTRKYGWGDRWMWLRGRMPSQDEILFTLADIADATGDLTLLEQILKRLKPFTSGDMRPHNVWVRAGMGLAHHATPEKLDLLVEPFAYYLRIMHLSRTRNIAAWLPPEKEITEFLESTLHRLETLDTPTKAGTFALLLRRDHYWAERRWGQGIDSSHQVPLLSRLHSAAKDAFDRLDESNEIVLNAEQVNAMNYLMQHKLEPELQLALVKSAPYWGDRQTVNALERLKGQYGLSARLREAIDQTLAAMPARLERLHDRRTLMRTTDPSQETMTLMRAADQVKDDIPTEQLMRVSMGEQEDDTSQP